jgi:hypothetical protein
MAALLAISVAVLSGVLDVVSTTKSLRRCYGLVAKAWAANTAVLGLIPGLGFIPCTTMEIRELRRNTSQHKNRKCCYGLEVKACAANSALSGSIPGLRFIPCTTTEISKIWCNTSQCKNRN